MVTFAVREVTNHLEAILKLLVVQFLSKLTQVLAECARIIFPLFDGAENCSNVDQSLGSLKLGPAIAAFLSQLLPLVPFLYGATLQIATRLVVKLGSFNTRSFLPLGDLSPSAEVVTQILPRNLFLGLITVGILDLFDLLIVFVCHYRSLLICLFNCVYSFPSAVPLPSTEPVTNELAPEHASHTF